MRSRRLRRTRRPLLALVVLVLAVVIGYVVDAARSHDSPRPGPSSSAVPNATGTSGAEVPLSALPAQAATTVHLIESGGPFPYPRDDGVVFHNYEHVLPRESDGYYREYTVPTPGSDDRGARRIVTGKDGSYWYTGDHYDSFQRVDVSQ